MIIPIVMATDKNYIAPTYITIYSMLKNKNVVKTMYNIYILISDDVSEEQKNLLLSFQNKRSDVKIKLIDMKNHFQSIDTHSSYITTATYYRLMLPELLFDIDICLYLDTDIIVCQDLLGLYRYAKFMKTDYYIAGVKELPQCISHYKQIGLPDALHYFNAGVILMNLKMFRDNKTYEILLNETQHEYLYHDQDILNKVCYGKVLFLPVKYNKMIKYYYDFNNHETLVEQSKRYFNNYGYNDAVANPVIVHFSSPIKPWWGTKDICTKLWWQYYDELPEHIKNSLFKPFLKKEYRGGLYFIKDLYNRLERKVKYIWERIILRNNYQ